MISHIGKKCLIMVILFVGFQNIAWSYVRFKAIKKDARYRTFCIMQKSLLCFTDVQIWFVFISIFVYCCVPLVNNITFWHWDIHGPPSIQQGTLWVPQHRFNIVYIGPGGVSLSELDSSGIIGWKICGFLRMKGVSTLFFCACFWRLCLFFCNTFLFLFLFSLLAAFLCFSISRASFYWYINAPLFVRKIFLLNWTFYPEESPISNCFNFQYFQFLAFIL